MRLIAIKDCPQGQRPGDRFEAPDAHAQILIMVGAAKADDDDPPRPRYRRRDLRAHA